MLCIQLISINPSLYLPPHLNHICKIALKRDTIVEKLNLSDYNSIFGLVEGQSPLHFRLVYLYLTFSSSIIEALVVTAADYIDYIVVSFLFGLSFELGSFLVV